MFEDTHPISNRLQDFVGNLRVNQFFAIRRRRSQNDTVGIVFDYAQDDNRYAEDVP
jgi:hypothetical protein